MRTAATFVSDRLLGNRFFCDAIRNSAQIPVLDLSSRSDAVGVCPGDWSMAKYYFYQLLLVNGVVQMLKLIRNVLVASFLSVFFSLSHAAPVNINTADAATLAQGVNGIGPSKAQAIVDYRAANGSFASVDDLVKVQGIGFKTLDRIREFVIATPDGVAAPASPTPASPSVSEQPAAPAS